jgi:hypothetical protein
MRHRKLLSTLAVGALAFGTFGFGPGNSEADTPEEAENGCPGINEARDHVGDDNPASDVLDEVARLLSDDECEEHGSASGEGGGNGEGRP